MNVKSYETIWKKNLFVKTCKFFCEKMWNYVKSNFATLQVCETLWNETWYCENIWKSLWKDMKQKCRISKYLSTCRCFWDIRLHMNFSFQHDLQPPRYPWYMSLTLRGSGSSAWPSQDTMHAFALSTIGMADNTISCLRFQTMQTLQLDVCLCFLLFYTPMGNIIEEDFKGTIAAPGGCTCQ